MRVRRRAGIFEAALLALLFVVYELVRGLARDDVGEAGRRGWQLLGWERALHLPSELSAQKLGLAHTALTSALNNYYVWVHFPATAAFLLWLWWRRPEHYPRIRTALVAMTGVAMVLQALTPVAPPRLLPGSRFVDTMAVLGPSAYDGHATASLANQYAAFPSLHVGWALLVAYGVVATSSRRVRWLAVGHPVATVAVVVMTANHYWIDGLAAAVLLAAALAVPVTLRAACCRLRAEQCRERRSWQGRGPCPAVR